MDTHGATYESHLKISLFLGFLRIEAGALAGFYGPGRVGGYSRNVRLEI